LFLVPLQPSSASVKRHLLPIDGGFGADCLRMTSMIDGQSWVLYDGDLGRRAGQKEGKKTKSKHQRRNEQKENQLLRKQFCQLSGENWKQKTAAKVSGGNEGKQCFSL
jgi:hypothetical protein